MAEVESEYLETHFHLPIVIPRLNQGGDMTVAAGDSFNLSCAGENVLQRNWLVTHPGSPRIVVTNTTDNRRTVVYKTDRVIILFRGVSLEDGGLYQCLLANAVDRASININVTVIGE
jgi:hypothetical protein